ncbi:MAG: diiron oxygenase, partial [Myxococcota bacterium]
RARWHSRILGRMGRSQIPAINPYLFFMGILAGEEPPDHFARAARDDAQVHPIVRRITSIHSIEEARHIAYAREFLEQQFRDAPRWQQAHARFNAPISVRVIVGEFFTPRWPSGTDQAPVGLRFPAEMKRAIDLARRQKNPVKQAVMRDSVKRVVGFFREIGAITERDWKHWRRWGLVEA